MSNYVKNQPKNTNSQPQEPQPERVQYEGKSSEGFSQYSGKLTAQQVFAIANELSQQDAAEVNKARALLTAKRIEQHAASPDYWGNVAGHLQTGLAAKSEATAEYLGLIDGHFAAQDIDPDFFTKSLNGQSSTLLLGAK